MDNKYIVVNDGHGNLEAICFTSALSHKMVAGGMQVVGAGFWRKDSNGRIEAFGASDTLGIPSRTSDARLIKWAVTC